MSIIRRAPGERDFTILRNEIFNDERISADGLGVLCYLLSKPDNWHVSLVQLQGRFSVGRDKMQATVRHLRELGYMTLLREQGDAGRFKNVGYLVSGFVAEPQMEGVADEPQPENPVVDHDLKNRQTVEPADGKPGSLQRTEILQRTELHKSPIEAAAPHGDGVEKLKIVYEPRDPRDTRRGVEAEFDKLSADDQALAILNAPAFCKASHAAGMIPYLITYLRERKFLSAGAGAAPVACEYVAPGSARWNELAGAVVPAAKMHLTYVADRGEVFVYYPQRKYK